MAILYLNDNLIEIKDMYDPWATAGAGEYITTGTVSAQIKDTAGTNVGSAITMTYYAARGGVSGHWWVGIIEEDAALTVGTDYDVTVTATASTDRVGSWTQRHRVVTRTA
jgi:hypothetical protein